MVDGPIVMVGGLVVMVDGRVVMVDGRVVVAQGLRAAACPQHPEANFPNFVVVVVGGFVRRSLFLF